MLTKNLCVLIHIRIKGEVGTVLTCLSPPVIFVQTIPRPCLFCGSCLLFIFQVCFYYSVLSAPCSLVITCWEKADLLALFCVMFPCFLSFFHMLSQVGCGT